MNRIKNLIYLFITLCLYSSCSDNDSTLSIATTEIEFSNTGGEQTITIDSDDDWSIYGVPEWLNISAQSGINKQEVTLSVDANNTGLDREQMLTVRTNDSKNVHTIKVLQYANAGGRIFAIDNNDVKYFNGASSSSYTSLEDSIVISSSVKWKITGPDWLKMNFNGRQSAMNGTIKEGSGTIYLNPFMPNDNEDARQDTIYIQTTTNDILLKIPVVQLGIYDVKCVNMKILSDGFWTSFKYGRDAQFIQYIIYEGAITAEQVVDKQWKYISADLIWGQSDMKPNSDYTICTRIMPTESTFYKKINIEVIHTSSDENQPRAKMENAELHDDAKWHIPMIMNEYAKGYYALVFPTNENSKTYYVRSAYYNIKRGYGRYFTQNMNASLTDVNHTIVTWAVDKDDNLSNVVDIYKIYPSESSSTPTWQQAQNLKHVCIMTTQEIDSEQFTLIK